MEEFRVIPEYPNYLVSNYGRVMNKKGMIISLRKASNGYLRFNVRKGNVKYEKPKTLTVHRVVAELFLERVEGKNMVNHKDCDKTNNHVDNLEWCTNQENCIHAVNNIPGLIDVYRKSLTKSAEKRRRKTRVYKDGVFVDEYNSAREASEHIGLSESTINKHLNGKLKKSRSGYSFFCAENKGVE